MTQHLTSILIFCDCLFHLLIEYISSIHSTHWYPGPTTSKRKTHWDTQSCFASSSTSSGNQNIKWDITSYLLRCLLPKNPENNKCWWGCEETGTFVNCWSEYKTVLPLRNTVPQKTRHRISIWYMQMTWKQRLKQLLVHQYKYTRSLQHYSQPPKRNSLSVHQQVNE